MWCWRRLLRVPRTARRSNQSILKEISTEYSLEGQMLKLKLQYFGHLMGRTDSFEKHLLMLGDIEGGRRRGWQDEVVGWHHWLDGHEFEQAPGGGDRQGILACCSTWGNKELDTTERLNWTELKVLWAKLNSQHSTNVNIIIRNCHMFSFVLKNFLKDNILVAF